MQKGPDNKKEDENVRWEGEYGREGRVGRGEEVEPCALCVQFACGELSVNLSELSVNFQ